MREGKSLVATELGEVTTDFMCENFPEVVDYEFTAEMESQLDSIEQKQNTIVGVLGSFYSRFKASLDKALESDKTYSATPAVELSDVVCEKCGKTMVFKKGKYGRFLACPSFPACKNTKAVDARIALRYDDIRISGTFPVAPEGNFSIFKFFCEFFL